MPQGNAPVLYSTEPQESPHFLPTNVAVDPMKPTHEGVAMSETNHKPQPSSQFIKVVTGAVPR